MVLRFLYIKFITYIIIKMKILFIIACCHHKNLNFIKNCKNIDFYFINSSNDIHNLDLAQFDCVFSPSEPINVSKYPDTKFIFGPRFSVFPIKQHMEMIKGDKTIYIQPSLWAMTVWKNDSICNDIKLQSFCFGVDTQKFIDIKPIHERNNVIIYFKHRNPRELQLIELFLQSKSIQYKVFSYDHKYNEYDYISYLQNTKFMICVDAHESQGFAIEEALSCNVPLLVWNVSSMNQEYGVNYNDIPATTIPYWNESCGEFFYTYEELNEKFNTFISKLNSYNPRKFVLDNLSIDVCEQKLIDLVINI